MSVATLPTSGTIDSDKPVGDLDPRVAPRSTGPSLNEPKLKVCVLAACPFPANHGTPGSIRELAEATAERGHEVHIVSYHFGDDLPLKNVHLHRVKDLTGETEVRVGPTKYRPLYDFQMIFKTIEVVRKHNLDLIHAHSYEAALAAAFAKPLVRRPILYSAHCSMGDELASYDFFSSKRFAEGLAWLLDRTVPKIGDRCIPHSTNLEAFLHERGLADRTEPVLNFGIDIDEIEFGHREEVRTEFGIGDEPVVLYSGVIDNFQRLDLLVEAMKQVLRRDPRSKLVVLSSIRHNQHEHALLAAAKKHGVEKNLILYTPSGMQEGLRLLPMADVAVVPRPAAPGFPIKLLNYLAAALPSVQFASSASRVSHGEHVWLASEDTAESLGHAITQVLRDENLRDRIAAGGHRFVRENHDRRVVAENLCAAYQRLVEPTKRWAEISQRPKAGADPDGALIDTVHDALNATIETKKYPSDEVTAHAAT